MLGRLPFPGRPEWSSELLALAWPNSRAWGVNQLTEERCLSNCFSNMYTFLNLTKNCKGAGPGVSCRQPHILLQAPRPGHPAALTCSRTAECQQFCSVEMLFALSCSGTCPSSSWHLCDGSFLSDVIGGLFAFAALLEKATLWQSPPRIPEGGSSPSAGAPARILNRRSKSCAFNAESVCFTGSRSPQ